MGGSWCIIHASFWRQDKYYMYLDTRPETKTLSRFGRRRQRRGYSIRSPWLHHGELKLIWFLRCLKNKLTLWKAPFSSVVFVNIISNREFVGTPSFGHASLTSYGRRDGAWVSGDDNSLDLPHALKMFDFEIASPTSKIHLITLSYFLIISAVSTDVVCKCETCS